MDRPVPVKEAARLSGVTPRAVYRWIEKGAVQPYATPGGRLRVVPKDCLPSPRAFALRRSVT